MRPLTCTEHRVYRDKMRFKFSAGELPQPGSNAAERGTVGNSFRLGKQFSMFTGDW
jgi:hypothetical protein